MCHEACKVIVSGHQGFQGADLRYARLQGENVVRASGVPFAVVRPTALTEEPAGAELQVDQGDTIKARLAPVLSERATCLSVELAQCVLSASPT